MRARKPTGSPASAGGQYTATAKSEPGFTLAGPVDRAAEQAAALSDLADIVVRGHVFIDDEEAVLQVVPNVPASLLGDQMWQDVLVATVHRDDDARIKAIDALVRLDAREARWRNDPTFIAPTGTETVTGGTGPVHYTTVTGSKYTGWRDVSAVARDVRVDLKNAVQAGYLPDGLQFGVTVSKFSGGQAMRVSVRGLADDDIYRDDPTSWSSGRAYSTLTAELQLRVGALAGAYDRETSEMQTDFYRSTYYAHVEIEDERGAAWRQSEAVRSKAKREIRNGVTA